MRVQVKTGSEWHSTERRGAMVRVDGSLIYEKLKPLSQDWEAIGNKGKHGRWCVAEYDIPTGSKVDFAATANDRENITHSFIAAEGLSVNVDGYTYNGVACGWIVSL